MRRLSLFLPVLSSAALSAVPAASQSRPLTVLTVAAEARIDRAPDVAEISAGVVTVAPTAAAALRGNADAMARVAAAVRSARVADRDIQTVGLSLQPQYDYQDRQAPRLTGYQAQNTVSVRLRDIARAGLVVDALVAAGANQIGGPTFRIADEDAVLDQARAAAVARARARAELYARATGLHVARIIRVSEGAVEAPQPPRPMMRMMSVAATSAPTPVSPGEVGLTATVTIEFELE